MQPFVSVALKVIEELHMTDKKDTAIVMRFAKIYPPEKMGDILKETKSFNWWERNKAAAFMKAVKTVNTKEKENAG